uniref:Cilia- and flagella-associated protein 263 n=1 Tax=Sparus aurata TaxID=8175 RepID=A0A671YJH3_SPAAU
MIHFCSGVDSYSCLKLQNQEFKTEHIATILETILTLEQKLYVAQREVRETLQDQEKLKQKYENIQDNYKASLKEAELRLADIRKAKKEFERRLLKPMKDNRLEMKEPERVLQYIGDKSMVAQSEKYNLKNHALKVHEKKLQQQLQQRRTEKDTGAAEFKVENRSVKAASCLLSVDCLQLVKSICACVCQQDKLQNVTRESAELSSDISNRKQMLAKIEEEIQRAEEERLKAEALKQHLRRQMTDYQAPDIAEYMHVKDRHKKLQQSIHTWERKVGIAQVNPDFIFSPPI